MPICEGVYISLYIYIYLYIDIYRDILLWRDKAPVSVAAPATAEKHRETTTQLSTPSLFNYCHIITAIYLHSPHSHQTNTGTGGWGGGCTEVEKDAQTHTGGSQKTPGASSYTSGL